MDVEDLYKFEQQILEAIKVRYKETGVAVSPFFLTPPDVDVNPRTAALICGRLIAMGKIVDSNPDGIPEFIPVDETQANP